MKVIIAGSRTVTSLEEVKQAVEKSAFNITEVVSGGAQGVDRLGERLAALLGIPVRQFIPDWNGYAGKRAGFVRNTQMAQYADALVAIWDGKSKGTRHMIDTARQRGIPVYVLTTELQD
jgi:hypothetical protein